MFRSPQTPANTGSKEISPFEIRDAWIKKQMAKRRDEFTEDSTLHIFLGTWNVNAKNKAGSLNEWLRPSSLKVAPDVYGIGLQEIVDLNAANIVVGAPKTAEPWTHRFRSCLGNSYVLVCSKALVGILLCVFVRKEHFAHVKDVMIDTAGVGILNVAGNKGGVAVRFGLYDSTVCIVNSHLAAHKNNVQGRNDNFSDVSERLRFSVPADRGHFNRSFDIHDHDFLFWIGDLNYRLTLSDLDMVHERIVAKDWSFLLSHDQLLTERSSGRVFRGYREGRITFPPTYKYQPNSNVYERRPEKKLRFPAWCDRIMWTSKSHKTLLATRQLFYERAELQMSDHKPVMSLFRVNVKLFIKEKQMEIYQSLVRQLDAWENEQMPKISMSSNSVDFGLTQYATRKQSTIEFVNDGTVIAQFQFIPKLQDNEICRPWLKVEPEFGIIPPNEKMEVTVSVFIEQGNAFAFNARKEKLEDILILRLENGRDYFIAVSGTWQRTCFGSPLSYLVLLSDAARTSAFDMSNDNPQFVMSVPKELWRMVDFIYKHGLGVKEIFLIAGDPEEEHQIVDALDLNSSFGAFDAHSMASVLIRFLQALHEPVVPISVCVNFARSTDRTSFCQTQMLLELPQVHYNTFIFILAFLRELLENVEHNELSAESLAIVFAKALTHAPMRPDDAISHPASTMLYYCLTSSDFV